MQGRNGGGQRLPIPTLEVFSGRTHSRTGIQPLVNQSCACTFPLLTAASLHSMLLILLHAGQQYQLGLSKPYQLTAPIPPFSPPPCLIKHLTVMLIGLPKPKKVYGTVKLLGRKGLRGVMFKIAYSGKIKSCFVWFHP